MIRKKNIIILLLFFHLFMFSDHILAESKSIFLQKITLDRGFSFIYDNNENSKNTALQIAFYGGNSIDSLRLKGISQLTSRMIIQISGSNDIKTIVTKNSACYMRVKGDYIIITIECISEYFDEAVKIFFKTIAKPDITSVRLNFLKKRFKQMQMTKKDDYHYVLNETILNTFFEGTGYEGSIYGNSGSLKNIKRKDISRYHKETINLSNMLMSISTDLNVDFVSEILNKNLKYFSKGTRKERKKVIPGKIEIKTVEKDLNGDLYTIAYAFPLRFDKNSIKRKDFILGKMIENYLGKGIGSYLWTLRTDEKLTYSINSRAVFFRPFGYLYFFIKTEKKNISRTLELFKTLTDNLFKGVDKERFDSIVAYTSAFFQRQNELKRALTYNLVFFEVLGLGFDFYTDFPSGIKDVTLTEFNKYLKETLNPSNRLSIVLGDKD